MKILLVGDTHRDTEFVEMCFEKAIENKVERILQLGDFGWGFPPMDDPVGSYGFHQFADNVSAMAVEHEIPFYWIDGNHDNHWHLRDIGAFDSDDMVEVLPNVYYIPRGTSWVWGKRRFLGLGGAFSIDKDRRTLGVSYWDTELITTAEINRAIDNAGSLGVDIMVSHDAPHGVAAIEKVFNSDYKMDRYSRSNRDAVRGVMDAVHAKFLFHGHFHWNHATFVGKTRVYGLACDCDPIDDATTIIEV